MYGNGGGSRRKERKVSLQFREPANDGKVRDTRIKKERKRQRWLEALLSLALLFLPPPLWS